MNNSTWVNKYDDKLDETKSQNLYRFFAGWHGSSRSLINLTSAHICSLDAAELSPPPRRRLSLLSEWICEKSRKRRNPSSFSLALSLSLMPRFFMAVELKYFKFQLSEATQKKLLTLTPESDRARAQSEMQNCDSLQIFHMRFYPC